MQNNCYKILTSKCVCFTHTWIPWDSYGFSSYHVATLTNLVSMIFPKANDDKHSDLTFVHMVRHKLVFAAGFHKVHFCYCIILCWAGVCLPFCGLITKYISYSSLILMFHSVSVLITVMSKFLWIMSLCVSKPWLSDHIYS